MTEPFILTIFGASGDLTRRKLVPAVYGLYRDGLLPDEFRVIGFARRPKTDDEFRDEMRRAVDAFSRLRPVEDAAWAPFASRLDYHRADFGDIEGFRSLRRRIEDIAASTGTPGNCLFYLAAPPDDVAPIVERLREAGLARTGASGRPWSRLIVEKPFGRDLESARDLNRKVLAAFDEGRVFRIDHYLGKETVQNILVLRFANSIFEPLWNQKYVDHVQIAVAETVGVEGRGNYYERAGALRDMIQNHILQLLCLVAMEPPVSLEPDAIRDEKTKVLRALRPIPPECAANGVVRAQYGAGTCQGQRVPGYVEEPGVPPGSATETYVAFKAFVDNWRWSGVPFYLRTGKRLAARVTSIGIHFKPVPQVLFNAGTLGPVQPNVLAIRVQPAEGITLRFEVKVPGQAEQISSYRMDFSYADAFGKGPPEAYERLLLDAAQGNPALFTRSDAVEAAWAFVAPVVEGCTRERAGPLPSYPAGSWGPREADDLIAADGRRWEIVRRSDPPAGQERARA